MINAIIDIISEILTVTGFGHPGAFIRWLLGGCRKRYSDIYKDKSGINGLVGGLAMIVLLAVSMVFFLLW